MMRGAIFRAWAPFIPSRFVILALPLLAVSCSNEVEIFYPVIGNNTILAGTTPLDPMSRARMEGVYEVLEGSDLVGADVVVKWSGNHCSVFSGKHGGYFILSAGKLDSTVYSEGTWRYSVSTETGIVQMTIAPAEGGTKLINDTSGTFPIVLRGRYGEEGGTPDKAIVLRYLRPFSATVTGKPFWILGHRGGGRNSDYIGVSENSLPMIDLAERFGANGIEIDVFLSTDNVPFVYHDPDLNLRLTRKGPLVGDVEDFSWPQLRTFVRLKHGELIPTLREALEFTFDSTNLRFVWLDMKAGRNAMPMMMALQTEFHARPLPPGRDSLEILIGLPKQDQADYFLATPGYQTSPALCELSLDLVAQTGAIVWAPRWTAGTQNAAVADLHAQGKRAFTWTLDVPVYINDFLTNGQFDGVLTNYPTIVAYEHYRR